MQTENKSTNSKTIIYFGDFIAGHSTEVYIAHAFTTLGYRVFCLQDSSTSLKNIDTILDEIDQIRPEFILFSKGKLGGEVERFMDTLKFKKIKTVCWLFDLYFGLNSTRVQKLIVKEPPFNSDIIFSTDGGHDDRFKELGINHKCLRQGIHEKEAILYKLPKTHDIIFVGADHYKNRGWLLNGLADKYGDKFEWIGFPKEIRGLPLNELYASTKIVVGDSQPSPKYWSNRIYETLGRGGFLIHPRVEGIEEEFEDGKHLVLFERGNLKELYSLIDYYLTHEKEREKIRKAGFELVKSKYTYKERCKELLKNI